jgi:multiple sugar transport system substrate-binding protein
MRSAARALAALCLLGAAAMLSSCQPRATVVTFWTMGTEGEFVLKVLPEFERMHPGIKVRIEQLPWTAAHEKLLTAYAGDALPDLAQLGNSWLPEMATLNALEALAPYARNSAAVQLDDYFDGVLDTNRLDGELYGIPWYVDTRLLFYRRDLLAQAGYDHPPRDWTEWRAMFAAIKLKWKGQRMGILLPVDEFEPLLALTLQQDGEPLRDQGRFGNFRGAGFSTSLGFYRDLFAQGYASNLNKSQVANTWDEFAKGSFVFYISGPWNIGEFSRRMPASLRQAWMTAPLPGPAGPSASTAGGSSMVLFKKSRHKKEAWALIEYLARTDVQLKLHAMTGNLPPRRSVWNDPRLVGDAYARAFRDQLERVRAAPKVPQWERIVNEMQLTAAKAVHAQLLGDASGTALLQAELDSTVDGWLEKRRSMMDSVPQQEGR